MNEAFKMRKLDMEHTKSLIHIRDSIICILEYIFTYDKYETVDNERNSCYHGQKL